MSSAGTLLSNSAGDLKHIENHINERTVTHPVLSCLLVGHCPQVDVYVPVIFSVCGNKSCDS